MIESVEPFRTEFNSLALSYPERLEGRKIEIDQPRAGEDIGSGIAERDV